MEMNYLIKITVEFFRPQYFSFLCMHVCAYVCLLVGAHVYARVCVEGQKTTLVVVPQVSSTLVFGFGFEPGSLAGLGLTVLAESPQDPLGFSS